MTHLLNWRNILTIKSMQRQNGEVRTMRVGHIASQWVMQHVKPQQPPVEVTKETETVTDLVGQAVSNIQEARNDMGEDDPKVQQLMEKFKGGRKLTPDEMNYIQKHAPGAVEYIDRIMREREMMELSMRLAPSKMDVQTAVIRIAKNIEKRPDAQEREVLMKHLADAKQTYEQTDEYKEKPNSPLDREEGLPRLKFNKRPVTERVLQLYEQQTKKTIETSVNGQVSKEIVKSSQDTTKR